MVSGALDTTSIKREIFGSPDHLGCDEKPANSGASHHFGFRDRCHAYSDSTLLELTSRDLNAFVRLGMRPERNATLACKGAHSL